MDYRDFNIHIPHNRVSGEVQTTCPECSHTRKKKSDKCLSINLDKQTWYCHHCNWSGILKEKKEYVKPQWVNITQLSENAVKWFSKRGISQGVLHEMKITEGKAWMPQENKEVNTIQFNYFRESELINIKYRDAKKNFKLAKDAELIFYNIDCLKTNKEVYIVEGEMDCLTLIQLGIKNVISVPNGATTGANKLDYVDNCIDKFDKVEKIILATDNDIPGRSLAESLRVRFGTERCYFVELGTYKDANECLVKSDKETLLKLITDVKEYPLEGIFTIKDYSTSIMDMYHNGMDTGVGIEMSNYDKHFRIVKGYFTMVTGIPGHGKSDWVDQIVLRLKILHNWKSAFFSPENKPTKLHFSKMSRKLIGKGWLGNYKMTESEVQMCMDYLDGDIWFIKPEKDYTLDSILSKAKQLKQRNGIDLFIIDAWNKIQDSDNDLGAIRNKLNTISKFCEDNNMHCLLVAHPRKMQKLKDGSGVYEVPQMYDIGGSNDFYNIPDNGISVYRNFKSQRVEIHILKVKFDHWGHRGMAEMNYHLQSGRYFDTQYPDIGNWITEGVNKRYQEYHTVTDNMMQGIENQRAIQNGEPLPFVNDEDMKNEPF